MVTGIFDGFSNAVGQHNARQQATQQQQAAIQERQRSEQAKQRQGLLQSNLKIASDLITAAKASNNAPDKIQAALKPLIESVEMAFSDKPEDVANFKVQVGSLLAKPTGRDAAVAGANNAAAANTVLAQNDPITRAKMDKLKRSGTGGGGAKITGDAARLKSINDAEAAGAITSENAQLLRDKLLKSPSARKADAKAAEAGTKALGRLNNSRLQFATVSGEIDKAIALAKEGGNAGVGAILKFLPQTDARKLNNLLDTIRANIGFDKLQDMRANSPTGGALGQVSNLENMLLQATQGKLDQFESTDDLIKSLNQIKSLQQSFISERLLAHKLDYGLEKDDPNREIVKAAREAIIQRKDPAAVLRRLQEKTGISIEAGL